MGGGGGGEFLVTVIYFIFIFFSEGGNIGVFGGPHARGSRGVGKRYTSSYDHDM